jgi:hypothetical protein
MIRERSATTKKNFRCDSLTDTSGLGFVYKLDAGEVSLSI